MTHTTHNKGTCLICGKETQPEKKCTCKFRNTQHTTHNDEAIINDLRRTLPQDILGAMEYRGFYDCGKYLDDSLFKGIEPRLRQALSQARADQDKISRADERERIHNAMYDTLPTGNVNALDWTLWAQKTMESLTTQNNNIV